MHELSIILRRSYNDFNYQSLMLPVLREGIDSPETTGPLVFRDPVLRPETHFPVNVVAWEMFEFHKGGTEVEKLT